ncbi:MAG: cell wall-active antibiotics response protein [bacterium]|nr:cell wall-active antibiotics response protein [bacterium]
MSRRSVITPRLVFGLLLIFIGLVFALDQLNLAYWEDILQFWPVVLIVAGAGKLFWPGSASGRVTGLILMLIGAWLLLEELDYIYFSFWDYWPLVLVLIGIYVVWQGVAGGTTKSASDSGSTVNAVAILGGASRTSNSGDFRGGDMVAFMGGCDIDLRQARISHPPAVIDAFAFWGGVEIKVPEQWSVSVRGVPLLGGYEDKTRPPLAEEPASGEPRQELIIKGFAIMGGVEIKN